MDRQLSTDQHRPCGTAAPHGIPKPGRVDTDRSLQGAEVSLLKKSAADKKK
jgi:hypothetical protein